jgi:hypothetical protein
MRDTEGPSDMPSQELPTNSGLPIEGVVFVVDPAVLAPEARDVFALFANAGPLTFGQFKDLVELRSQVRENLSPGKVPPRAEPPPRIGS